MDTRAWVAANLTARLLAEPWTPSAIAEAVNAALGPSADWQRQALIDDLAGLAYGT